MANPADIVDIIQTPALIKDDFIKAGKVVVDEKGNPIHYVGGFAVVFPFYVKNEKWAFRCWYNNVGNIGKRLKLLSEELSKVNLPYFCHFQYIDNGIVLDGAIKPTTRMFWIDGLNIKEYICKNANDSIKLKKLASDFKQMCSNLHHTRIAHGDLQHGNIIVDEEGMIFLIDYDSLYLPALNGEKDIILGLAAYQHPSRIHGGNIYAHEKLDYFSELIIYLSILAVAEFPSLVNELNIQNCDNLLFTKDDYNNIKSSSIYNIFNNFSDEIQLLLNILEEYLNHDSILDLKPFESYLESNDYSKFCIKCGSEFCKKEDCYCIECGTKRI